MVDTHKQLMIEMFDMNQGDQPILIGVYMKYNMCIYIYIHPIHYIPYDKLT